jgi:hypothetical protein
MKMKLIQEMVESAEYKVRKLREGRRWLGSPPMRKILDSLDYLAEKHNASTSTYFDGTYNSVYLTLKQLSGLKDEGLAALLNSLQYHEPDDMKSEDDARSYARNYRFVFFSKDPDFYGRLTVTVTANFREDSETCKRVVTGYKAPSQEQEPIYELRCEDAPSTETNLETK